GPFEDLCPLPAERPAMGILRWRMAQTTSAVGSFDPFLPLETTNALTGRQFRACRNPGASVGAFAVPAPRDRCAQSEYRPDAIVARDVRCRFPRSPRTRSPLELGSRACRVGNDGTRAESRRVGHEKYVAAPCRARPDISNSRSDEVASKPRIAASGGA